MVEFKVGFLNDRPDAGFTFCHHYVNGELDGCEKMINGFRENTTMYKVAWT